MDRYDQQQTGNGRNRRAEQLTNVTPGEPSMSAPQPMPGKPAATYAKPAQSMQWSGQGMTPNPAPAMHQGNQGMPDNPGMPVSQGVPPAQTQGYGWQQGYVPQQPVRGWTQPYPQQPQQQWQGYSGQNGWQPPVAPVQWMGNGYVPPEQTGPEPDLSEERKVQQRKMLLKLIAVAAVVIAVVIGLVIGMGNVSEVNARNEQVTAYDDRYCEGVYVDGIHLGGMTREEAQQAVQSQAQQRCDAWNIRLETDAGDYVGTINAAMLGLTVDVHDALEAAWQQGRSGTIEERKAAMDALLTEPFHTSTAQPSGDASAVNDLLNMLADSAYLEPTDAYTEFKPENTNPFTIHEGTYGRELDVEPIKAQISNMLDTMTSGTIVCVPTLIAPSVTKADLQKQVTLIGSHYTVISSTSTENRNKNIERACDLINGTRIDPGKTFSFNGVVGARTQKNGFYTAIEYAYGEQREGYGGGVCQVSSTIYVAAVRANMEITKREQHSLEVNYTDFGFDATVNYEGRKIDFVFRNNTDSPVYIITKVKRIPKIDSSHNLVVCEIYGPALDSGVTYDIVTQETVVPVPTEVKTIPDKEAQYVIYTDETHTVKGSVGYEVDSYKVKYVNGKEVERTLLAHDSYAPVQTVVYVGVSERPLDVTDPW